MLNPECCWQLSCFEFSQILICCVYHCLGDIMISQSCVLWFCLLHVHLSMHILSLYMIHLCLALLYLSKFTTIWHAGIFCIIVVLCVHCLRGVQRVFKHFQQMVSRRDRGFTCFGSRISQAAPGSNLQSFGPDALWDWVVSRGDNYQFDSVYLIDWGGRYIPKMERGAEVYRWITSLLLHQDFAHIFNNSIIFLLFATHLEHKYGTLWVKPSFQITIFFYLLTDVKVVCSEASE